MSEQQADYPTSGEPCAWNDPVMLRECPYPAWTEDSKGFCLYHSRENEKTEKTARQVWAEARRKAKGPDPDFSGWHFPEDPDEQGFMRATFQGGARFRDATFQGGPWFLGVTFQGNAWFMGATFQGVAHFEGATFQGMASFRGATFQGGPWFLGATFQGDAQFEGITFQGTALFYDATFQGNAEFDGATFQEVAWFEGATFQRDAEFRGATFQGNAWFWHATFQGDAGFEKTTFRGDALFSRATFQGKAEFSGAKFEAGVDVHFDTPSPVSWLWGRRSFRRTEEGETAYRLAKQAAQARGDYTAAGRYHYAEQCAIESRARKESSFRPLRKAFWTRTPTWLARLLFGRIIFGYGERPQYPLLLALAVIACWTGLYWHLDAIEANPANEAALAARATLRESVHFSVVTFTTLGYGDFQPKADYQLLADSEAVLGAGLMATFIVCLTRKYMR